MPSLRSAMRRFLKDFQTDISKPWRDFLRGVTPAFGAIAANLSLEPNEPIFPGRKGRPPEQAPARSHVFRALDGIKPPDVRIVVIGQDPYPDVRKATGRAFEQGNLESWTSSTPAIASSLKRIMQLAAHGRSGRQRYLDAERGWTNVRADIAAGTLTLNEPPEIFDVWQKQGVLFLNTALTLTRYERGGHPHQTQGHIPLWAPVVGALCMRLAQRTSSPTVFLSWGAYARQFLRSAGILASANPAAVAQGLPNVRVLVAPHPSTAPFLRMPNHLLAGNDALQGLGAASVTW